MSAIAKHIQHVGLRRSARCSSRRSQMLQASVASVKHVSAMENGGEHEQEIGGDGVMDMLFWGGPGGSEAQGHGDKGDTVTNPPAPLVWRDSPGITHPHAVVYSGNHVPSHRQPRRRAVGKQHCVWCWPDTPRRGLYGGRSAQCGRISCSLRFSWDACASKRRPFETMGHPCCLVARKPLQPKLHP
jgi:hypothetical protein